MTRDEAISLASISFQLPNRKSGAEAFIETLAHHGFVVVPREPTEAMIKAGANEVELFDSRFSQGDSEAENVWAAMIEVYEDFPPGSADLNQASLEAMITTYKDEGK